MTVLVMVAVRDRAANTFARPFFTPTLNVAIRSFTDEINRADKDNPLWMHPDDYDLYELGWFDDNDAGMEILKPKMVCVGKDVRLNWIKKDMPIHDGPQPVKEKTP